MKNILLLTTMYPNPVRPGTKVCHYFAQQWVKMGYNVIVIHYRSMFPWIYTFIAGLFPKLAQRYIGNHVEMDRNQSIIEHTQDGIPVYSVPIYKYFPHGKYPSFSINKQISFLKDLLLKKEFVPDAVIGHFYNPQLEIISKLKKFYPNARTCLSLHELDFSVIKKRYPRNYNELIHSIDVMGYRSLPIKKRFEKLYGAVPHSFLCYSGVSQFFLDTPFTASKRSWSQKLSRFIYVGQFIKRKYPKAVIEALNQVYPEKDFHLTYVGKEEICYDEVKSFVELNNLLSNVSFKGQIKREEIIKEYDTAECFIMISRNEVFGLVYLEAMSRGCIVVAAKDEGMEDIIEDGINGFMCNAGDTNELALIIKRINSLTAEEKQQISINARKTAERLSDFNVAKTYIENVLN